MKRRVVVTGLGAVSPLGTSVSQTWENAIAGKSGIGPITRFDASPFASRIAGEIKNFDPLQYVDKKVRRYDPFAIYALAAQMAMEDASLTIGPDIAERIGIMIGSGMGGALTIEKESGTSQLWSPQNITVCHSGHYSKSGFRACFHAFRRQGPHQLFCNRLCLRDNSHRRCL